MNPKLAKAIRGKDHRAAFKAIAALRRHAGAGDVLDAAKPKDDQRAFQSQVARIVARALEAALQRIRGRRA